MRIAIDAGHGMSNRTPGKFDPGALGGGFREADIALAYAITLRAALTALGIATVMIRDSNATPTPLGQRVTRAALAGATAFVSLHLNASENPAARGVEVYWRDEKKDKRLAEALQAELVRVTGFRDRGAKRANFAVLKFKGGPAVLLELGFITNSRDLTVLLSASVREAVCTAIAQTLREVLAGGPAEPPAPQVAQVQMISGKMSTFGGPGDGPAAGNRRADWASEGLAFLTRADLMDPRFAGLFLPTQPPGTSGLARRLDPNAFYVACRFEYDKTPKTWLRGLRARVRNPRTGAAFDAWCADWRPHPSTGRVADLSPGLARALGLTTDDLVEVFLRLPPQA